MGIKVGSHRAPAEAMTGPEKILTLSNGIRQVSKQKIESSLARRRDWTGIW